MPGIFEEQQKGEYGLEHSDQGRYGIKYVTEWAVHVMEDFIGHYKDYGFYWMKLDACMSGDDSCFKQMTLAVILKKD